MLWSFTPVRREVLRSNNQINLHSVHRNEAVQNPDGNGNEGNGATNLAHRLPCDQRGVCYSAKLSLLNSSAAMCVDISRLPFQIRSLSPLRAVFDRLVWFFHILQVSYWSFPLLAAVLFCLWTIENIRFKQESDKSRSKSSSKSATTSVDVSRLQ